MEKRLFTSESVTEGHPDKICDAVSDAVLDALRDKDVALLRGDWTRRDPVITRALASYGRSGVPTNVIYTGVEGAEPIILPEALTPGIVLEALEDITDKGSEP